MRRSGAIAAQRIARPGRVSQRAAATPSGRADAGEIRNPMNDFIGYKIKRLQHAIMGELEEILRPYKLRAMDFAILTIVQANPGVHQGGVASLLGAEPPAVVLASDRLEGAGLIARHADPSDRRLRTLYLTPAGAKLLPLVIKDVDAQERKLRSAIQSRQVAEFEAGLDRLMRAYAILK